MLRRRWPIALLVAWSAFVWVTRINNAWGDASASTTTKVGATVLSVSLLALAAAAVAVLVRARRRPFTRGEAVAVKVLAGWTTAVWVVRAIEIATADYSANPAITNPTGFKVVHVVLGAVSITLAALSWRVAGREASTASPSGPAAPVAVSLGAEGDR